MIQYDRYRERFNPNRPPSKLPRAFESSSWRVMRQQPMSARKFTRPNAVYADEASRDIHIGTVFAPTNRRIGSTFLLHPSWV